MSQTYRTRVLTARDRLLVDRLALYPRYAPLVERLTGEAPKTAARRGRPPKRVDQVDDAPAPLEIAHEPPAKPSSR